MEIHKPRTNIKTIPIFSAFIMKKKIIIIITKAFAMNVLYDKTIRDIDNL